MNFFFSKWLNLAVYHPINSSTKFISKKLKFVYHSHFLFCFNFISSDILKKNKNNFYKILKIIETFNILIWPIKTKKRWISEINKNGKFQVEIQIKKK